MPKADSIDWDDVMSGCNYFKKTTFKTPAEMLEKLYDETGSVNRMEDILGPSHATILKKMKSLGIKRLPKGHRGHTKMQDKYRSLDNPENMTIKEIAQVLGCTDSHVHNLRKSIKMWEAK